MKKSLYGVLLALTVGTGLVGGWKLWHASEQRREAAALAGETAALQRKVAVLTSQQKAHAERVKAIEADNQWLQASLTKPTPTSAKMAVPADEAEQRIEAALAQTRGSVIDSEATLRELLWGLDEGIQSLESSRKRGRTQLLVNAIIQLGERYPPALVALREQQAAARAKYLEVGDLGDVLHRFAFITRALRDQDGLIALFDSLPSGSDRRREVGSQAYTEFVAARRYKDAVASRSLDVADTAEMRFAAAKGDPRLLGVLMKMVARDIEALAGAGANERAHSLMARMLALDGSEENRALLRQHLERAGRLDLLP